MKPGNPSSPCPAAVALSLSLSSGGCGSLPISTLRRKEQARQPARHGGSAASESRQTTVDHLTVSRRQPGKARQQGKPLRTSKARQQGKVIYPWIFIAQFGLRSTWIGLLYSMENWIVDCCSLWRIWTLKPEVWTVVCSCDSVALGHLVAVIGTLIGSTALGWMPCTFVSCSRLVLETLVVVGT
jgi:hypothetical protein